MKRVRKLGLILVILVAGIFLTGCNNIIITAPDCCQPPIAIECNVTVISISPNIWGEILVNGQGTGEYFLPYQSYQSITINNVVCNGVAVISILDDCGYLSHEESVYVAPGSDNYVVFDYWADYWDGPPKGGDIKSNNCHC